MNVVVKTMLPAAILAAFAAAGWAAPAPVGGPETPRFASDDLFGNPRRSFHRFDDFVFTGKERLAEVTEKLKRARTLITSRKADGLLISTGPNFEWITAGARGGVDSSDRRPSAKLLVTLDRLYAVADDVDGPRLMDEELAGLSYELVHHAWNHPEKEALQPLLRGKRVLFDDLGTAAENGADEKSVVQLSDLYFPITPGEAKKYGWLGRKVSDIVEQAGQVVRPGMAERDVEYLIRRELDYWAITPAVVLVSADERTRSYLRPASTGNAIKRYVGIDVSARRWGLTVSLSRRLYFGEPDAPLAKLWKDAPRVPAVMLADTRPGRTLGEVVTAAEGTYREVGHADEWKLRDLGGPLLTDARAMPVLPGDKTRIQPGQVIEWRPMVGGARFGDTYLVQPDGALQNLTAPINWPTVTVKLKGVSYYIPGLLVRPEPVEPAG